MTNKNASFGPDKRTPQQIKAGEELRKRIKDRELTCAKVNARTVHIAEEVVKELARRARIDPNPICPHCGQRYNSPVLYKEERAREATDVVLEWVMREGRYK